MANYNEAIRAKLGTARCSLDALRTDMDSFIETQRDKVQVEKDGVRADFDAPPIEWSIRIGEIAYHLRSVLDHLVHKLVCDNRQKPSSRNSFPVVWDIDRMLKNIDSPAEEAQYFQERLEYADQKLEGVSEKQKSAILSQQGFLADIGGHGAYDIRVEPSEFRHLAYLNNVDKHRHLNLIKPRVMGLSPEYRERESRGVLPDIQSSDFDIAVCWHFEKEDDRPTNLTGEVVDTLESIFRAVKKTIDDHVPGA